MVVFTYSNKLKCVLEKIFEDKKLIENFRREIKDKTMELLAKNGYKKSKERMEQDMIEILNNFNIEDDKLSIVSGGVKNRFDLFKKASAMTLAGLSMCSDFSKNSYATNNTNTSSSVVKKQEKSNSNIKNKSVSFLKKVDVPEILTVALVTGSSVLGVEHLFIRPLLNKRNNSSDQTNNSTNQTSNSTDQINNFGGQSNQFSDYANLKYLDKFKKEHKTEKEAVTAIFKQLRSVLRNDKLFDDYLNALENFGLKLCDYKPNFKLKPYTFEELLNIKGLELQKLLDATEKIYKASSIDFAPVKARFIESMPMMGQNVTNEPKTYKTNDILYLLSEYNHILLGNFDGLNMLIETIIRNIKIAKKNFDLKPDMEKLFRDINSHLDVPLKGFLSEKNKTQYGNLRIQLHNFLNNYYYIPSYIGFGMNFNKLKIDLINALENGINESSSDIQNKTLRECLIEWNMSDNFDYSLEMTNEMKKDIENIVNKNLFDKYEEFSKETEKLFSEIAKLENVNMKQFLDDDKHDNLRNKIVQFLEKYFEDRNNIFFMKRNFAKTPSDTIQNEHDKQHYTRIVENNNNITVYKYLFDTFQYQNGHNGFGHKVCYVIFKEEYQHISGWLSNIILSKRNQPQQNN